MATKCVCVCVYVVLMHVLVESLTKGSWADKVCRHMI